MNRLRGEEVVVSMGVRLTAAQKAWLDRESERQDRSVTWLIRKLVEKAMIEAEWRPARPVLNRRTVS
jgi:hypothetical protein